MGAGRWRLLPQPRDRSAMIALAAGAVATLIVIAASWYAVDVVIHFADAASRTAMHATVHHRP